MRRFGVSGGVAVVALLAAAVPASAGVEGRWSKTFTVTSGCGCNDAPLIASSARYGSTVAWLKFETRLDVKDLWARRRRDGSLAPKRKLGNVVADSAHPAAIAVGQSGAIVLAWQNGDGGIHARRISPRGKIGRLHRIASYGGRDIQIRVAVDTRGNAMIAWAGTWAISSQGSSPPDPPNVHVRRLSAKGNLGPTIGMPRDVAYHEKPTVAVAPSGRATVVWSEPGAVRATTVDPGGVVGPVRQLNAEPAYGEADVAIDARGDATVVWQSSFPEKVTVRRINAAGVLGPVYVPAPGDSTQGGGQIGLDANGIALVTWGARGPFTVTSTIESWRLGADGAIGPVANVSPPGLAPPDFGDSSPLLVVDRAGDATIAWLRATHTTNTQHFAALARRVAADGTLGPVHTLAGRSPAVPFAALGVNARGIVTAVWTTGTDFSAIKATRFTPRR